MNRDKIRGSLIGGAAGDALGYSVEFIFTDEIYELYGPDGIREFDLTRRNRSAGVARFSDDTQMTLFTANALLVWQTLSCLRGAEQSLRDIMQRAYLDWLRTQTEPYMDESSDAPGRERVSWLLDVPGLYVRRAPGRTCTTALKEAKGSGDTSKLFAKPRNDSKGCGGVMRIAPMGLISAGRGIDWLDRAAAEACAITHGHPLGYMTGAALTHVINRIVYPGDSEMSLREIILEARDTCCALFENSEYARELSDIIELAIALSENTDPDSKNIDLLGAGWVAEETLAIAFYCALRYENDFSAGLAAAVNHDGDSDSTGAVTGNILGAICGYEAIDAKWKTKLELHDLILEVADDLSRYPFEALSEGADYSPDWLRKYSQMRR